MSEFQCANGRCIDSSLHWDGQNDCIDNSDEKNCKKSLCEFGTCSHVCVDKKNSFSCHCAKGYYLLDAGSNDTCTAHGNISIKFLLSCLINHVFIILSCFL